MVEKFGSAKGLCLLASTVALMLGLVGCGGGGGGGGSSSPSGGSGGGSNNSGVVITANNAANVGGVAMAVAGGQTASALNSAVGVETTTTAKPRLIARALEHVAAQAANTTTTPQSVVGAVTPSCSSGTVTVNMASSTSGTITFNACSDASGETLNGTVTFTGLVVSPDDLNFQGTFSVSITFTEPGSPALTLNGDFSIGQTCSTTTNCTTTLTGSSLRLAIASTTLTLSNFALTEAETATSVATSANLTVSVTSSTINGSLTVVTTQQVVLNLGDENASSGVVEVTGLNSKAKVTVITNDALATAAVEVDVDGDNNGVYEFMKTYSWAQITT
jgi:hypothetical protein